MATERHSTGLIPLQNDNSLRAVTRLGRSRFHAPRCATHFLPVAPSPKEFRVSIRQSVPDTPGVYAMVDREESVVYVGKSVQLRERVLNYFVDVPTERENRTRPRKEHRIGNHARRLLWQPVGHELVALLRELELIQSLKPRFNVRGAADRGRSGYLYLTSDEAPTFRTAPTPPAGAVRTWGPMLLTRSLREAVERLNHTFGLRDCTTKVHIVYRDQGLLWDEHHEAGCLRAAFGACLAPCAGGCTRSSYSQAIRKAVAFLDGADSSILDEMQQEMQQSAVDRKFERAARLRDTLDCLDLLDAELSLLRDTPDGLGAFVLPLPDRTGQPHWLLFIGGIAVRSLLPPTTRGRAADALSELQSVQKRGRGCVDMKVDFECESVRTVAGWFRQNPAVLDTAISVDMAIEICQRVGLDKHCV